MISRSAVDFNRDILDELVGFSKPFLDSFGLTHFAYNRFPQGQKFLSLNTDLGFLKHMVDRGRFDPNDYLRNLPDSHGKITKVFWPTDDSSFLYEALKQHNYWHGLSLLRREGDIVEAFHFATSLENAKILNLYLNEEPKIIAFLEAFKKDFLPTIDFTNEKACLSYSDNQSMIYENVQANSLVIGAQEIQLSPRQSECLHHLTQGLTIKESARLMGLSPETVKSYVSLIKAKSGCGRLQKVINAYLSGRTLSF